MSEFKDVLGLPLEEGDKVIRFVAGVPTYTIITRFTKNSVFYIGNKWVQDKVTRFWSTIPKEKSTNYSHWLNTTKLGREIQLPKEYEEFYNNLKKK